MLKVDLIPILKDNYVFLIVDENSKKTIIVDPGEYEKVFQFIQLQNYSPIAVLATHHHADHIGGISEIKNRFDIPVYAPLKNQNQIKADFYIKDGDEIELTPFRFKAIDLPGHTLGHCSYWFEHENWLFSGDVIFGLGCGRLFEGTFEQAFSSLQKIKNLPKQTQIFCTHEYTETNLKFCKSLNYSDSDDFKDYELELLQKRKIGLPSVPLSLSSENKANPFLLAENINEFARLRELRNSF